MRSCAIGSLHDELGASNGQHHLLDLDRLDVTLLRP